MKTDSEFFLWNSTRTAALLVLKLAVRVVRVVHEAILLADLIMPRLSVHLPFFSAVFDLFSLPGKSLLISVRPWPTLLAAAAATAARDNADQDDSTEHSQGNDQGFKV